MLYPMLLAGGFNGLECALVLLALTALCLIGARAGWSRRERAVATLLILPVLILTAHEATQFMTMDEWGLTAQLLDPSLREFRSISLGAFAVGLPVALPLVRLGELLHVDPATTRMLLKALWWLLGQFIVAALATALLSLRQPKRRIEPHIFAGVFTAFALLPTTQLALKTFNYDLLSFGLGTLAVLLLLRRVTGGGRWTGWCAFICAALAAREKLTGGPILLLIISVLSLPADAATKLGERTWRSARTAALHLGIALGVSVNALFLYRVLAGRTMEGRFWLLALDPLIAWAWVPLGMFFKITTLLAWRPYLALAMGMVFVGAVAGFAALAPRLRTRFGEPAKNPRVWAVAALLLLSSVFMVGAIGAVFIHGYWAPYYPTTLAAIANLQKINGISLHVGASSLEEHLWKIVAYAMTIMVVAIPTPIWVVGAIGAIGLVALAKRGSTVGKLVFALIVLAIVTPILSALAGVPFAHRYFNLNLALLAAAMLLAGCTVTAEYEVRRSVIGVGICALFVGALILEVAPFQPLFAAFRPFWLEYSDSQRAEPGKLNASWMGWGEEVMKGGKILERACRERSPITAGHRCSEITLVVMQSGLWLPGPRDISLKHFSEVAAAPPLDDKTFYIVNRLYLIQKMFPIPNIVPDISVSYRGYDLAWIWRGDRLKASGYDFKK